MTTRGTTQERLQLQITTYNYPASTGSVVITHWEHSARIRRAVKYSAISFALAAVTLFIPLAHFILTPLFLLATPLVFLTVLNRTDLIAEGKATCPGCQHEFDVMRGPPRWPFSQNCPNCLRQLTLNR